MEKEPGRSLAEKFEVSAVPFLLFLNGDGEVVHQFIGYRSPQDFLMELEKAYRRIGKEPPTENKN